MADEKNKLMNAIPGIGLVANLASSIFNAGSSSRQNKKNRNLMRDMYAWQRRDALADWNMENAYNSPAAQMQRLKEAGLNPNLVYGNGADAQGGSVRNTNMDTPRQEAPQLDLGTPFMGYADASFKQAQIDQLKTQNVLTQQQVAETAARTGKILQDTEIGKSTLERAGDLAQASLDGMRAQIGKTLADTRFTLNQDERAAAMQTQNIKESTERILKMRIDAMEAQGRTKLNAQQYRLNDQFGYADRQNQNLLQLENLRKVYQDIKNGELDAELKAFEKRLNEAGLTKGDNAFFRVWESFLQTLTR